MKKGISIAAALALAVALAVPAPAQETGRQSKAAALTEMKTELVRLNYVKADTIRVLLSPYLSEEGRISFLPNQNNIVLSDHPENVAKMREAIRQLDVKPADLELTVQLVLGAPTGEPGKASMTDDPVIRELRNLLKYKAYSLLDASLLRAMDGSSSEIRLGDRAEFSFHVRPKVIRDEKSSLIQMEVLLRQIRLAGQPPNATSSKPEYITSDLIGTTLNIRSGDKTVVGVSRLDGGDKGLILIISGKVID